MQSKVGCRIMRSYMFLVGTPSQSPGSAAVCNATSTPACCASAVDRTLQTTVVPAQCSIC